MKRRSSPARLVDVRRTETEQDIDVSCINTIRTLAIDAIEQAQSGHPGAPMAMAPVVYVLWQRFLRFDVVAAAKEQIAQTR